ncbi:biotin--[acetyl-CoA-carboxylase] ligase [Loktanella sp. IMCC34160]|uniref:biotin--[acetyl-CoA-carboxylase] ligase n=1 Tax=Loktanella sp. IMCC34160 TaxID=2510646 RepID=UPI00101C0B56|nr:biotin--[acetyl-CoA-carboxylase] ligase [Loktanella sp. IMCC34160]RYG90653.1 biotin--[acetyl-CoA-carboxylase] ligase [Loktanella sp. IMCC34160]
MSTDRSPGGHWPEGYDRLILDEVDSTMAEAARRVGLLDRPTWIMARRQTAGKGRQGRPWSDPPGNLAATLIFRPEATPAEAARRSFLAANALLESLAIYTDRGGLAQKWPNDVLLNGGKVAGILLESSSGGPFVNWLSIGVGVNLRHPPAAVRNATFRPVSLLDEGGEPVAPEVFLTTLASAYATQERKLSQFGFGRIRADWLRNAARLGEEITARTPREEVTGLFDTVDEDGNLVLITATGPRRIAAADVYF